MIKEISQVLLAGSFLFLFSCNTLPSHKKQTAGNKYATELKYSIGDRLFFALNSTSISKEGMKTLIKQAEWLCNHKKIKVTIEGHCDERGTKEINIALGERRAEAVKLFLIGYGVDSKRINTISYGKEKPVVIGSNESSWAKNRRGVLVIQ